MNKVRNKNIQKGYKNSTEFIEFEFDSAIKSNMMTLEELRSFPGFEKVDDKEGYEIINSLHQLSLLTYEVINK
jgi:hypothetical protein